MCLESLKLLVRIEIRVFIVQTNDHAQVNQIRFHVVHKRATIDIRCKRPPNGVLHVAFFEVRITIFDLPDLFEPDSVVLDACCILIEREMLLEPFS